jgi:hypothetical protein
MDKPTKMNRAAIVMSAGALIMSAGIAGAPAVAGVFANNSDKVDGLHAVKSNASKSQRKGKLVATSAKTGLLNSGTIGNDVKFPAKVPLGVTLRGAFGADAESVENSGGDFGGAISYNARMPAALTVEFSPTGASTANCPGTAAQPQADPGFLCVYVTQTAGTDGTFPGVSTPWAYYFDINSATTIGSDVYIRGTWAAHAPTSVGPRPVLRRAYGPQK